MLNKFKLYAITDLKEFNLEFLKAVDAAYAGGVDIIQLRSKHLNDHEMIAVGKGMRSIATHHRKLFIVNDRLDLALATRADGVHLGQDDMPIGVAKRVLREAGKTMVIGKSTHSLVQALEAEKEGVDYIGVGPVFETPSKPGRPAAGLEYVKKAAENIKIPFVAIGGINQDNMGSVLDQGAESIAVIRAIFDPWQNKAENFEEEVYESARSLREQIESRNHTYV